MDKINHSNTNSSLASQLAGSKGAASELKETKASGTKSAERNPESKSEDEGNSFASELAQAGAATQAMPQTVPHVTQAPTPKAQELTEQLVGSKAKGEGLVGGSGLSGVGSLLAGKAAASLNTANAFTGLNNKPWSKDWVIGESEGADVKPLFGPSRDSDFASGAQGAAVQKLQGDAAGLAALQAALKPALQEQAAAEQRGEAFDVSSPDILRALQQAALGLSEVSEMNDGKMKSAEPVDGSGVSSVSRGFPPNLNELGGDKVELRGQPNGAMPFITGTGQLGGGLSGAEFVNALRAARNGSSRKLGEVSSSGLAATDGNIKSDLQLIAGGARGAGLKDVLGNSEAELATGAFAGANAGIGSNGELVSRARPRQQNAEGAIEGGPLNLSHLIQGGQHGQFAQQAFGADSASAPMPEVTAQVTKGAMSQDRLSSIGLTGISTSVRNFAAQANGGEFRIRLKPDNLGELHVRVTSRGNDVGLHIQASNEHAKQILEASMSHLREGLASQNLNLGRIEVTVAGAASTDGHGDSRSDLANSGQHGANGDRLGGQQGGRQQGLRGERDLEPQSRVARMPLPPLATRPKSAYEPGRLDVRA